MTDAVANKLKLSVIIITYNEEKRIRRCLASVRWADEIVVVDQSSTDKTAAVCREYTGKVFVVSYKGYCEPDRPAAVSKAANDWILYVDADEEVSPELRGEITAELTRGPSCDAYYIPRKNMYLGRWMRHSGWYPGYVPRLFRKNAMTFSERIHDDGVPAGKCGYLKSPLIHYAYESLEEHARKTGRYTDVLARQAYERGERVRPYNIPWKFLLLPSAYFLQKYIVKRGFLDGVRGLLIAAFTFRTIFVTNVKVRRIQNERRG